MSDSARRPRPAPPSHRTPLAQQWGERVAAKLVGRRIEAARYLTPREQADLGWHRAAVIITLDDGTELFPSQDDEGNGPGAIFTNIQDLPTIPVV